MAPENRDKVDRWVRAEVRALSAYSVPDVGDMIKLDAMENPYPWPEQLRIAWLDALRSAPLNRYPDPASRPLKDALRSFFSVPQDKQLLLGNGSDELIQMTCMTLAEPGRVVLAPGPTFSMYRMIALCTGLKYVEVPLQAETFALDEAAMLEAIDTHQPAVVFLSYPNNPTGNAFDADAMCRIIERCPGVVVVDEAYSAFADDSFMARLAQYDHLLMLCTLSKMGMAGLRLGMLAGSARWLDEFDKIRLPYNVNVLTERSVTFALQHRDVFEAQTRRIRDEREMLKAKLDLLPEVIAYPSSANFILFRVHEGRADEIFSGLKNNGVLIKNLHGVGGMLSHCLRVTVGTPEQNSVFLDALVDVL
ncbi:MAG: histidinol-phosphate transaminase [Gammaproteobacteria bacterium]|nr:histidinol-phosphate transaminase [Gammaproteobacteria bacterium]